MPFYLEMSKNITKQRDTIYKHNKHNLIGACDRHLFIKFFNLKSETFKLVFSSSLASYEELLGKGNLIFCFTCLTHPNF